MTLEMLIVGLVLPVACWMVKLLVSVLADPDRIWERAQKEVALELGIRNRAEYERLKAQAEAVNPTSSAMVKTGNMITVYQNGEIFQEAELVPVSNEIPFANSRRGMRVRRA